MTPHLSHPLFGSKGIRRSSDTSKPLTLTLKIAITYKPLTLTLKIAITYKPLTLTLKIAITYKPLTLTLKIAITYKPLTLTLKIAITYKPLTVTLKIAITYKPLTLTLKIAITYKPLTLTLKRAIHFYFFCTTLPITMMHYHTKFCFKMFSCSEDVTWTNINCFFMVAVTLTSNTAIQYFHSAIWLKMIYHQTKSGCKRIISSKDIVKKVRAEHTHPHYDPDLVDSNLFFAWHSSLWSCITTPSLVTKGSADIDYNSIQ